MIYVDPHDFDEARDSLLVGDMYDGDWPEPVHHPSKHILQSRRDALITGDASSPAMSDSPVGHAPGDAPSSRNLGANLPSTEQPGRGSDRAA